MTSEFIINYVTSEFITWLERHSVGDFGTPCIHSRVKTRFPISVSQSASQSAAFSPLRVIKSIFPLLEGTRFGSSRMGRARIRHVIHFYYFSVSVGSIRDILYLPRITSMESAANEGKYFYAPTLLFLFSVVNCAQKYLSQI